MKDKRIKQYKDGSKGKKTLTGTKKKIIPVGARLKKNSTGGMDVCLL
jgi:hypothetical protein